MLLKPNPKLKKQVFDYDFSTLMVKGRQSRGNLLTRNQVHKITLKAHGESTLGGRQVWFDHDVHRLNYDAAARRWASFTAATLCSSFWRVARSTQPLSTSTIILNPTSYASKNSPPTQSGLPSFLTPTSRASLTSSGSPSNVRRATAIPASSATTRPRALSCSPTRPPPPARHLWRRRGFPRPARHRRRKLHRRQELQGQGQTHHHARRRTHRRARTDPPAGRRNVRLRRQRKQ